MRHLTSQQASSMPPRVVNFRTPSMSMFSRVGWWCAKSASTRATMPRSRYSRSRSTLLMFLGPATLRGGEMKTTSAERLQTIRGKRVVRNRSICSATPKQVRGKEKWKRTIKMVHDFITSTLARKTERMIPILCLDNNNSGLGIVEQFSDVTQRVGRHI